MGAQLWHHVAAWDPNPDAALKALQRQFLAENYDLPSLLPQHLAWARESVAAAKAEGDEYGLVDLYEEQVRLLEELCEQPIPDSAESQIEIIRKINEDSGEGIGNVLDLTGVSENRGMLTAERLSESKIERLVGSARPNLAEAHRAISAINTELGRGECVAFPVYENGKPVAWCFVGNTID
jgi:hypothetical protein